ncbi:MAG: 2-dehydropantoate 2-reductase [Spirochaetia bacterium]
MKASSRGDPSKRMRIALIGPGSIGGATAAFLTRAGCDVEVVCRTAEVADRLASSGMRVTGARGSFTAPLKTVARVESLSGPKDLVLLATKAADILAPARAVLPFMGPESLLVSLQNGICVDALGGVVGRERVIGCVIGWGATLHNHGWVEVTSRGRFVIGPIAGTAAPRLAALQAVLGRVMPTSVSKNIYGDLYAKLILNCCFNALCAVANRTVRELIAHRRGREIFVAVMREAVAVADAEGLKVEPFFGILDFHRFLSGAGAAARLKRDLFMLAIRLFSGTSRPSTLQSLDRGQPTEIDYLNGYVAARGGERGVPTPVNARLVSLVHEIEAGSRSMGIENLDAVYGIL